MHLRDVHCVEISGCGLSSGNGVGCINIGLGLELEFFLPRDVMLARNMMWPCVIIKFMNFKIFLKFSKI